ncbi:hypothetical protein BS50DRAFT_623486 [Corynespora cassiicola Philippines]|uniref:Uncharacterized protein n=1 Tax=Corynespora cassiicola Philippines TaxID=1448308 RepID=A0A2T2NED4_CORCC|nr:hypothetical protein BS50DRAFT_623486 [Corynespora cassiicola Philippines]
MPLRGEKKPEKRKIEKSEISLPIPQDQGSPELQNTEGTPRRGPRNLTHSSHTDDASLSTPYNLDGSCSGMLNPQAKIEEPFVEVDLKSPDSRIPSTMGRNGQELYHDFEKAPSTRLNPWVDQYERESGESEYLFSRPNNQSLTASSVPPPKYSVQQTGTGYNQDKEEDSYEGVECFSHNSTLHPAHSSAHERAGKRSCLQYWVIALTIATLLLSLSTAILSTYNFKNLEQMKNLTNCNDAKVNTAPPPLCPLPATIASTAAWAPTPVIIVTVTKVMTPHATHAPTIKSLSPVTTAIKIPPSSFNTHLHTLLHHISPTIHSPVSKSETSMSTPNPQNPFNPQDPFSPQDIQDHQGHQDNQDHQDHQDSGKIKESGHSDSPIYTLRNDQQDSGAPEDYSDALKDRIFASESDYGDGEEKSSYQRVDLHPANTNQASNAYASETKWESPSEPRKTYDSPFMSQHSHEYSSYPVTEVRQANCAYGGARKKKRGCCYPLNKICHIFGKVLTFTDRVRQLIQFGLVGLITAILIILGSIFWNLYLKIRPFIDKIMNLDDWIKQHFDKIIGELKKDLTEVYNEVKKKVEEIYNDVKNMIDDAVTKIGNAVDAAKKKIDEAKDKVEEVFKKVGDKLGLKRDEIKSLEGGVKSAAAQVTQEVHKAKTKVENLLDKLPFKEREISNDGESYLLPQPPTAKATATSTTGQFFERAQVAAFDGVSACLPAVTSQILLATCTSSSALSDKTTSADAISTLIARSFGTRSSTNAFGGIMSAAHPILAWVLLITSGLVAAGVVAGTAVHKYRRTNPLFGNQEDRASESNEDVKEVSSEFSWAKLGPELEYFGNVAKSEPAYPQRDRKTRFSPATIFTVLAIVSLLGLACAQEPGQPALISADSLTTYLPSATFTAVDDIRRSQVTGPTNFWSSGSGGDLDKRVLDVPYEKQHGGVTSRVHGGESGPQEQYIEGIHGIEQRDEAADHQATASTAKRETIEKSSSNSLLEDLPTSILRIAKPGRGGGGDCDRGHDDGESEDNSTSATSAGAHHARIPFWLVLFQSFINALRLKPQYKTSSLQPMESSIPISNSGPKARQSEISYLYAYSWLQVLSAQVCLSTGANTLPGLCNEKAPKFPATLSSSCPKTEWSGLKNAGDAICGAGNASGSGQPLTTFCQFLKNVNDGVSPIHDCTGSSTTKGLEVSRAPPSAMTSAYILSLSTSMASSLSNQEGASFSSSLTLFQPPSTTPVGIAVLPCTPSAHANSTYGKGDKRNYTATRADATTITQIPPWSGAATPLGLHDWKFSCPWGVPAAYSGGGGMTVPSDPIIGELTFQSVPPDGSYLGACEHGIYPNDLGVAINWELFDVGRDGREAGTSVFCGRRIKIWGSTGDNQSKEAIFHITDRCQSCPPNNVDIQNGVYSIFTGTEAGRIPITWSWHPDNDDEPTKAAG